jgi:hypothetical protein
LLTSGGDSEQAEAAHIPTLFGAEHRARLLPSVVELLHLPGHLNQHVLYALVIMAGTRMLAQHARVRTAEQEVFPFRPRAYDAPDWRVWRCAALSQWCSWVRA